MLCSRHLYGSAASISSSSSGMGDGQQQQQHALGRSPLSRGFPGGSYVDVSMQGSSGSTANRRHRCVFWSEPWTPFFS